MHCESIIEPGVQYKTIPEAHVKRIVAMLILAGSVGVRPASAGGSTQINGWISDSMCGARHAGSGSACVKKCIEGGMVPVFVDEAKKTVWSIENPDAAKAFYGDHVTISATVNPEKKSVHIDSITATK
jgi:hypothetical protein